MNASKIYKILSLKILSVMQYTQGKGSPNPSAQNTHIIFDRAIHAPSSVVIVPTNCAERKNFSLLSPTQTQLIVEN